MFLSLVALGGFATLAVNVDGLRVENYGGNWWLLGTDALSKAGIFTLAVFTVYAFLKHERTAVFLGKSFEVALLVSNLFALTVMLLFGGLHHATLLQMLFSVIWCAVWFAYLCLSHQVRRLYPPAGRHVGMGSWVLVLAVMILPIVSFFVGKLTQRLQGTALVAGGTVETVYAPSDCAPDQMTDGRIIYTRPAGGGWSVPDTVYLTSDVPVFTFDNDMRSVSVCSAWDSDTTETNFDDYLSGWRDDDLEGYRERLLEKKKIKYADRCGWYAYLKYESADYGNMYWEFTLLYQLRSGKVMLVSCWSNIRTAVGPSKVVGDLLQNAIF